MDLWEGIPETQYKLADWNRIAATGDSRNTLLPKPPIIFKILRTLIDGPTLESHLCSQALAEHSQDSSGALKDTKIHFQIIPNHRNQIELVRK